MGASPSDVSGCSLRKINSTPFNTETIAQFTWHRIRQGPFFAYLKSAPTDASCSVLWSHSQEFFSKAEYGEVGLHNEKLSEDVIAFNGCHF